MKKTKILSLLLCLSLFCALIVPGTRAYADNEPGSGMKISKTATANDDGSYTITLEAYATGAKVISEITKDVPTDIILVLDQSGSMANDIGTVSFEQYKDEYDWWGNITYHHTRNQDYYEYRHNDGSGNLWHKLEDGSYVSVSVTKQEKIEYNEITNGRNNQDGWDNQYTNLWNNRDNLYALVGGKHEKVSVNQVGRYTYTYTYTLPDGTVIASGGRWDDKPNISGTDDNKLYLASVDSTQTVYTYTYTDKDGNVQTIGTSKGAGTVFSPALYERVTSTSGGGTRLDALKNAVNNFANAVHTKSLGKDGQVGGGDDIDHRIALVGFSSPDYNNTELLTGSAINQGDWKGTNISTGGWDGYYYFPTGYEMNGPQYGSISDAQYKAALLPMNTDAGLSGVATGVNALTAWGGTRTDNGLAMANKIFEQNPIPNGEKRNRVVIVFTDGIPGLSSYDGSVASSAITESNTAKTTYGATVYTIGIFSGADATSAGNQNGNETEKANWFMQKVSSNNGTPRTPSYYLSAGDEVSLNSIFQQISSNIETGGTPSTLTADAVVKDIISPQFTLPEGATASSITLETYRCTGKNANGDYTWSKNADAMGATASISGDQVNVTGFNFSENYVGTVTEGNNVTYRGHKLVISFKVQPKAGFLGGNDVITNTRAGIYENGSAQTPVMTFEQPKVDVPLAEPEVTVPDANVYLGAYYSQTVPEDAVKLGATVKIGSYDIDFSKADDPDHPYGLEPWQVEYVNISISAATTGNGGSFENIQEDISYTVTVTVSPKTPGTSGDQSTTDTGEGTIHVFKPQLTYQDSQVWYGGDVPTDFTGNLTEETWINSDGSKKHDDEGVQMLNEKPTLTLSYTPEAGKITTDGKVNTKQDIGVNATVKIGENDVLAHTTFKHTSCGENCSWKIDNPNGAPAFLLHVKTCTLTVSKTGGTDNESYVFDVFKDGKKYSEVTVEGNNSVTIYELPVGAYTIKEDTGWSWRYNAGNGNDVTLSKDNVEDRITCTNTLNKPYWLNGFSQVVRNIFGISH